MPTLSYLGLGAPVIPPRPFDIFAGQTYADFAFARSFSSYAGPCVRVRRSTGGEADFGFTARGGLDIAALMGFVGSASAYATRWYDQSGNGRDAVQATASAQPRIVNAGVLDVGPNGRPCLVFSGAQHLDIQNSAGFSRDRAALTYAAISRATGAAGQTVLYWPIAATAGSVRGFFGYSPTATGPLNQTRSTDGATAFSQAGAAVVSGAWSRLIGRGRYAAGAIDISVNGVVSTNAAMTPAQNTPNSDQAANVRIGATGAGSAYLTGGIASVDLAQSALDLAALHAAYAQVMP